jgi:hypothetical protein
MKNRDPLVALEQFVARHPTQAAAAVALGLSQSYLCDLLAGRRAFSDRVLALLGLKRVVVQR